MTESSHGSTQFPHQRLARRRLYDNVGCQGFGATEHRYQLAPENILPLNIAKAPEEVREAYRFAILNRDTLRYIPCYCGCGAEGHTSNASCYIKDSSTGDKLEFDRMSLA